MGSGIYVIHSPQYTERRANVDRLIAFFDPMPVTVVEGVFTDTVYYDVRFPDRKRPLTKGQIGCALAHLGAYERALHDGVDTAIIFEDDVDVVALDKEAVFAWIRAAPPADLYLLYWSGVFVGRGHDMRRHVQRLVAPGYTQMTCPKGLVAAWFPRTTLELFAGAQREAIKKQLLHIADGTYIHIEKERRRWCTIIGPTQKDLLFTHNDHGRSVREDV